MSWPTALVTAVEGHALLRAHTVRTRQAVAGQTVKSKGFQTTQFPCMASVSRSVRVQELVSTVVLVEGTPEQLVPV